MDGNRNGSANGSGGRVFEPRRPAVQRPPVREAAQRYLARGWVPTPLRPREKTPTVKGWQDLRIREENIIAYFLPPNNIGVLTGLPASKDGPCLVDVDCDAREAVAAARELLPKTGLVHGRAGKPASHYWYLVDGLGEPVGTAKFAFPFALGSEEPEHGTGGLKSPQVHGGSADFSPPQPSAGTSVPRPSSMLVELRAGGCQTMVPPSIHPSGELLRWEASPNPLTPFPAYREGGTRAGDVAAPAPLARRAGEGSGVRARQGEPARVAADVLRQAVAKVAACALLARAWPAQGTRDEAALALAGMLLWQGTWTIGETDRFVMLAAKIAGDEEWRRRDRAKQTALAMAKGKPVTGATRLGELLGADGARVVAKVREWLGLGTGASCASGGLGAVSVGGSTSATRLDSESPVRGSLISQVREEPVRWLWGGRIPLGKLTLLDGDPGLGKTLVALDLIARLTTGGEMPDGTPGIAGGAGAVLLSAEDGAGDTIRPRLVAAGADLARVYAVDTVMETDPASGAVRERAFTLPDHSLHLEHLIARMQARLVVFDPLMAYLDLRVNSWSDQHMRGTLAPLARLAQRTGAAILILRHLNKGGSTNALYRGGGSIGTIAAARSGLVVAKDPDDPDHCRVLASTKSNLGPPMPALRYRIEAASEGHPHIAWLGTCAYSADALLNPAERAALVTGREPTVTERAVEWLRAVLRDGERPATEVTRAALAAGITKTTLRDARERVGIHPRRVGAGGGSHFTWRLPADEAEPLVALVDPLPETATSDSGAQEGPEGGAA